MNKTSKVALLFTLLVVLSGCASLLAPKVQKDVLQLRAGAYELDTRHTALLFKVGHLGLSTYVGRFNEIKATLDFDPNNIQATKLEAIIEIDSLEINDPDLAKQLMGKTWFNQKRYPQASFKTLSVAPVTDSQDGSQFDFTGLLSFRGVEKPLTVRATFNGGANNILNGKYTLGFNATASFLRSDFGMGAFVPLVGDEIQLEAFAEFLRN